MHTRGLAATAALGLLLAACGRGSGGAIRPRGLSAAARSLSTSALAASAGSPRRRISPTLPGMPPVLDPHNIYAADRAGALSPAVAHDRPLIYVPNSESSSVDEIDPVTFSIIRHLQVGLNPQHVVPSYDLHTLWVLNDLGNSVTALNPRDGTVERTVPVDDPYNMYFTPDGRHALVVEEARQTLAFRDPQTMALQHSVQVVCPGIDHMDFTADGRFLIASCEFSAQLIKIDVAHETVVGYLPLGSGSSPQDVKTAPDGRIIFVADRYRGGVWTINPRSFTVTGFFPTGTDTHGLYVSRDGRDMYITNRSSGSVSVLNFAADRIIHRWPIPGGTPDMGGVSTDGKVLWLAGRYRSEIYALNTVTGAVLTRIAVGAQPHGLCVFPQPGRYSLGHTGVFR